MPRSFAPAEPGVSTRPTIGRQTITTMAGAAVLLALLLGGMAQEQVWVLFAKPVEFLTRDANGLSPGLPVRLSGFPIGRVDRVELRPDAMVRVTLKIQPAYRAMLGPRSRFRLDQEGIVGITYLSASADPSGARSDQQGPLVVHYDPPVDLRDMLIELTESRIPLNRLLNRTAVLAETALPRTLQRVNQTLESASALSRSVQHQSELTASQARLTLQTYDTLGHDGRRGLSTAQEDLGSMLPLIRETLMEIRATAQTSHQLLDRLSHSWLMPLLEAPSPPATKPTESTQP